MRLVAGIGLILQGTAELRGGPPIGRAAMDALATVAGLLLLAGLWTPVAGVLVAVLELSTACFSHRHDLWTCFLLGTLGVSLALLGPGAWSVDAHLFGWRRIDIRDEKD
jgi:uncharacterized membrane protein YphA (DoxX/SURF4 family)